MSDKKCFHFTNLSNVYSIRKIGLIPNIGSNSKGVNDSTEKVSFSEGRLEAAGIFANFYRGYIDRKNGKSKEITNKEIINEIKEDASLKEFWGEGIYLTFDGEGIDNNRRCNSSIEGGDSFDGGTNSKIEPNKLKVCLLTERDVNGNVFSVSSSRYDYALYLMCLLTEDDIEYKMRDSYMKESVRRYLSEHQSLIEKKISNLGVNNTAKKSLTELCSIYANLCSEDFMTLDEFCIKYKEKINASDVTALNDVQKGKGGIADCMGDDNTMLSTIQSATRTFRNNVLNNREQGMEGNNIEK